MKKALIIHGWEADSGQHWFQEEKEELENRGIKTAVPDMPNSLHPVKDEWVNIVKEFNPDEESILIGHSLGAPTILRYLEKADRKVGKVFLIAAFARDLGFKDIANFVDKPFDWGKIKENVKNIYVINQKKDPWVPMGYGKEVAKELGVEVIKVDGFDHFDKMDLSLINNRI